MGLRTQGAKKGIGVILWGGGGSGAVLGWALQQDWGAAGRRPPTKGPRPPSWDMRWSHAPRHPLARPGHPLHGVACGAPTVAQGWAAPRAPPGGAPVWWKDTQHAAMPLCHQPPPQRIETLLFSRRDRPANLP